VLAQQYYLLRLLRSGVDTSTSPAGLSSGVTTHVFWDADTWMFPSLLALHPEQADSMVAYRDRLLGAAKDYAQANGTGARATLGVGPQRGRGALRRGASSSSTSPPMSRSRSGSTSWPPEIATG